MYSKFIPIFNLFIHSITYSFSTKENNILNNKMTILRSFWEYCSYDLEKDQLIDAFNEGSRCYVCHFN